MSPEMLTAIAAVIAAVAWPLVILIVLLGNRAAVTRLLESIESLSLPGGIEGKFRRGVEAESARLLQDDPQAVKHVTGSQSDAARRVGMLASRAGLESVRKHVDELAREYERIRAAMPSGGSRTRSMEAVVTKLRTLALAVQPLLTELTSSPSPGDRLAAIVSLQVQPKIEFVGWLGDRFREERAFPQYHAALALLSAARVFGGPELPTVLKAIQRAKTALTGAQASDRWQVLEEAERSLGSRNRAVDIVPSAETTSPA